MRKSHPRKAAVQRLAFLGIPLLLGSIIWVTTFMERGQWWVELLAYSLPFVLVSVGVLFVALWVVRPPALLFLPACILFLLCLSPLRSTFVLNRAEVPAGKGFTVMSYNAGLFNPYRPYTKQSDPSSYTEFYQHLRNEVAADILCVQELYHSSASDADMTVDSIIALGGYSTFYTNPTYDEKYGGLIGVGTFSRYPALARGRIGLGNQWSNNGHWIDLLIGSDTVRVFNLHFQSMSIRWRVLDGVGWIDRLTANLHEIHLRLQHGHRIRRKEIALVERELQRSPHPVIICADLNALPYSYAYQRLNARYQNAFEHRGRGLGSTYHHFPWLIRIDNQFADPRFRILSYRTIGTVTGSDHYPIEAGYELR